MQVLEREIWRIAVENLDYSEQHVWAALAGARVNPQGWRRARAMLQNDQTKELRRRFLLTCVQRNRNSQLRLKALAEIADLRRRRGLRRRDRHRRHLEPRRQAAPGPRSLLQALVDKRIGRRDQAQAWVWRLASYTRELHEEYAVQRWPETKRLLGLLVNSSGRAHGRNARRLVHAARKQDRRLAVALLAAAVSHTPEGEEVLRGARMRMARKPSAVARELLRNFPKAGGAAGAASARAARRDGAARRTAPRRRPTASTTDEHDVEELDVADGENGALPKPTRSSKPRRRPTRAQRSTARWTSPAPRPTRSPPAVDDDEVAALVDLRRRRPRRRPRRSACPQSASRAR